MTVPADPTKSRYADLGDRRSLYVRFEPGFGLNVYIGMGHPASLAPPKELGMSIQGWEMICEMVDEWRRREEEASR